MTRSTLDLFDQPERGCFADNDAADSIERTVRVRIHNQTGKAVLVSLAGDAIHVEWIAKFRKDGTPLIEVKMTGDREMESYGQGFCEIADLVIPTWLAKDKGLI